DLIRAAPAVEHRVPGVEIIDIRPLLERPCQRGIGNARRNRIDAHPEATDLGGKAFHEQPDRGLGRTINPKPRLDRDGAHGGTGDQASAFLAYHDAPKSLEEIDRALDVEIDDAIEVLLRVVEDRLADVQARRSHRNIQPWK